MDTDRCIKEGKGGYKNSFFAFLCSIKEEFVDKEMPQMNTDN